VTIASILCSVAVAGGGKDDKLSMMDKNGDGKVTSTEHADGAKMMFTKMDSDKDGNVTAAEMDAAHASMKGKDHAKDHATARTDAGPTDEKMQDKKAYDQTGTGKSMPKMMSSAQKIAAMDTNNDSKLSAAEHAAGAKQMFTKMDADRDGSLTSSSWGPVCPVSVLPATFTINAREYPTQFLKAAIRLVAPGISFVIPVFAPTATCTRWAITSNPGLPKKQSPTGHQYYNT
jgi:Ca2+-binding EF-hand superfamily protein